MEKDVAVALHLIGDAIMQIGIGMNNIANAMSRSKHPRRRIKKDIAPEARKKTHRLTPYNLYVKDMMQKLRDENPAESPTDAFKRIGDAWKATTEDVKANYKVICDLQHPKELKQEELVCESQEADKQHVHEEGVQKSPPSTRDGRSSSLTSTEGARRTGRGGEGNLTSGSPLSRDAHADLEQRRARTEQPHDLHPTPWVQEGHFHVKHTCQKLPVNARNKTLKRYKHHNAKSSKFKARWNTNTYS